MSGYRRFIAYVYEYQKGKKGSNCGFIKVEVRNQRCRIELHLHCPGLPPQMECRTYGFVRKDGLMNGVLLGSYLTEADTVECMFETDAGNMADSGISFGKMGGIVVLTQPGGFFGTEWDDQPVRPDNFREIKLRLTPEREAQAPASVDAVQNMPMEEPGDSAHDDSNKNSQINNLDNKEERPAEHTDMSSEITSESIEEKSEITGMETVKSIQDIPAPKPEISKMTGGVQKPTTETPIVNLPNSDAPTPPVSMQEPGALTSTAAETDSDRQSEHPAEVSSTEDTSKPPEEILQSQSAEPAPAFVRPNSSRIPMEEFSPFDDVEFVKCWKIQPADLMRCASRVRTLRNNRFLQYGYYNFGHLLLAQRAGGRFVLGVPGGYDQQERFMANMFGFPYFKECRHIELPKNRGGYWYRLIDTPNFR